MKIWALPIFIFVPKSGKTNEPIPRKAGNRRTNGRTNDVEWGIHGAS